jgi:hypothetical protein
VEERVPRIRKYTMGAPVESKIVYFYIRGIVVSSAERYSVANRIHRTKMRSVYSSALPPGEAARGTASLPQRMHCARGSGLFATTIAARGIEMPRCYMKPVENGLKNCVLVRF